MKLLAVGGGSGGHVTPIVAVLHELQRGSELTDVTFICDRAFSVQARGIMQAAPLPVDMRIIHAGKFRRYHHFSTVDYLRHPSVMLHNAFDGLKLVVGIFQSLLLLLQKNPDIIFAKGGYVCLPVGIAARLLHVPLVIHDSDARPGLTSRVLAKHARAIATGYPIENYQYPSERTVYTGIPIGDGFEPVSLAQQADDKQQLGIDPATPLVVAIGGGLGAQSINDAIIEALPKLADLGAHAYVVAGKKHVDSVRRASQHYHNVTVVDFINEGLRTVLGAADVVVSRASATSLQELSGLAKPGIIVPSRALGDQQKNAAVYANAQAAIVLQDDEIAVPARLGREVSALLQDDVRRRQLSFAIHHFARPDAAQQVAKLLHDSLKTA